MKTIWDLGCGEEEHGLGGWHLLDFQDCDYCLDKWNEGLKSAMDNEGKGKMIKDNGRWEPRSDGEVGVRIS